MTSIIIGTAGHIDHGKTALVRALTGLETDRLREEKARGISIDLGFAHLDLGGGLRASFIDVPGHERFVRNMLAGVTGIDLVLLVIAADESIKPQTREHFDICRLLGLSRGIVVLTKADLVDEDMLGLVRLEAEELVAGSFLAGAPVCPVSAVTGQGIPELKQAIGRLARGTSRATVAAPFRMSIDRAFTMRGFGTVVTGTIISGRVAANDEVELHPEGRLLRVRGVQSHGESTASAQAGQRAALNLTGIEVSELRRGQTLTAPGLYRPTREIGAQVELLPGAQARKARLPVHFHAGAAELPAELRLLDHGLARIVLDEPALLLPGDRFILRRASPVETLGGGVVLDPLIPRLRRRDAVARLQRWRDGSVPDRIRLLVAERPYGISAHQLAAYGFSREEAGADFLLAPDCQTALLARLQTTVAGFHQRNPLARGIAKEELRTRELPDAAPHLLDHLLAAGKELVSEGDVVRLRSFRVAMNQAEDAAAQRIEQLFREAGLAVPATGEVLAKAGLSPNQARDVLQVLLRSGRLLRVNADLIYHAEALAGLRSTLAERRGQRFTVSDFKDWTGVSRKFAIPLLEFLDRSRVTRREGDSRLVL